MNAQPIARLSLFAAFLFLLAPLGAAQPQPPPSPKKPPPPFGWIRVESTPSGAGVVVDGNKHGTTPLWAQVKPGEHEIVVSKDGYLSKSLRVKVGLKAPQVVNLVLTKGETPSKSAGSSAKQPRGKPPRLSLPHGVNQPPGASGPKRKPAGKPKPKRSAAKPTNATIYRLILKKLSSYQTIFYVMEKRQGEITTIIRTYFRSPDRIRQETFPKGNEEKKRTRIIVADRMRVLSERLLVEESAGPFQIIKINLDREPSWKVFFETSSMVRGRRAWQVKFLKPDQSYTRGWFDVRTGVILRREDYPPGGGKPTLVGITRELKVNEPLPTTLFEF